jgi:hypothetical protein
LGTKFFDEHCMFGNDMDLSSEHQEFLEEFRENADENHMKFYVHKMTHSNIIKNKCKMVR